jgi:hypothetical protein
MTELFLLCEGDLQAFIRQARRLPKNTAYPVADLRRLIREADGQAIPAVSPAPAPLQPAP